MICFAVVSHYYLGKTVCFPISSEDRKPVYCNNYAPISCKVLLDLESNEIIKIGKEIKDESDDDDFMKELYSLKEIDINMREDDPYERKNIENLFTLSIDPNGSKDLDDALSIDEKKLYIHIADVTSYLKESDIDNVLKRGNTIYLRNSNIPMLSREFADNIISLLPNYKKRAITLEFNLKNLSLDSWYPSFINNNYQLSYSDVDNILLGKIDNYSEDIICAIQKLEKCYQKFKVSNRIDVNTISTSHKIIEEFMIHCNKSIAHILDNSLYRHHPLPYTNKAGYLQRFIGYQLNEIIPVEIEILKNFVNKLPQKKTIQYLTKHMMSKALYTTEVKSHWALNEDEYTHFTSPIRRASDIIVHYSLLRNKESIKKKELYVPYLNKGEEIQNNIENILLELDKRRNIKCQDYDACIIKVNTKGIECYIPELDTTYSFHISQCSNGEYLEYKHGKLTSMNYNYYLGKCLKLKLQTFNINSGKMKFNIIGEMNQLELL